MADLEPKRPRGSNPSPGLTEVPPAPENLVAEIVDQITEKQARAAENMSCSSCPEDTVAGTPYQAVLSCSAEEPGTS